MPTELARPGVEIIQQFRSVSPTVVTPTLVPCVVGVCRQIVDVRRPLPGGGTTLNSEAVATLPAMFVARAAAGGVYTGLDGLALVLSVSHGPNVAIIFSGQRLTPAQVAAQIKDAFGKTGVTAATSDVVGDAFRVRTLAANEFQTIKIIGQGQGASDPAVLAAFGLGAEKVFSGASGYAQGALALPTSSFPDPRKNLAELAIEPGAVKAYFFLGGAGAELGELRRDRAFLRNGRATPARLEGTVDLTTLVLPAALAGRTLDLSFSRGAPVTVTFVNPATPAAIVQQIASTIGAAAFAALTSQNRLVLMSAARGPKAQIEVTGGTAAAVLGLPNLPAAGTTALLAVDDGNGDAVTPLLRAPGHDFTLAATPAQITGTAVIANVNDGETLALDDGSGPQTWTFRGATTPALVLSQIQGLFGAVGGGAITPSLAVGGQLVLTHAKVGAESILRVAGGTALPALGLRETTVRGGAQPPVPGDELYADGVFYAVLTQVAPGGQTDILKLDRQIPISSDLAESWLLVAKGLPRAGGPSPELRVDPAGNVALRPELLRDPRGEPVPGGRAQLYVSYRAIRRDVSAVAKNPGLVKFSDTMRLESELGPIAANNPLALGLYFALLHATGRQVTGLGVDAASEAAPFGTVEAYARAASLLEGYEVYAIAPLTHDLSVGQIFRAHAIAMSSPEAKGERMVIFNPAMPRARLDALVASGPSGSSLPAPATFDTEVANLGALLLARGLPPSGPVGVEAGLYLDVGDGKRYSIASTSGSIVTVRTSGFLPGDNDDGYYATTPLPPSLLAAPFAVRVRGRPLVRSDGTPDKDGIAETYQELGRGMSERRFWMLVPDQCAAAIEGVEQVLDGFYLGAAIAGMIAREPPQQSFTNFPMTGFTRVLGSNDFLSERQLNVAAAGGAYIVIQDAEGQPLMARFALTTDVSSIEKRTDSILRIVDFTAKFLRTGMKNFIGRFNITQGFLDTLAHVAQGLLSFLIDQGVLVGAELLGIVQDEDAPDRVLVEILLDVPYPCNFLRLVLAL